MTILTKEIVIATEQCSRHKFNSPFYPGESCEDIYNKNRESHDWSGYYWITDGPSYVYCGMTYTGSSCEDIYFNNPETRDKSGYYRINTDQWTYCNMTAIASITGDFIPTCAGVGGGWRRIAHIDVEIGDECPNGWAIASYNDQNFCRTLTDVSGCSSALFSTNGASYQNICGKVRGYQKGGPSAFAGSTEIDNVYIDGVSITRGMPREHIWTYATGLSDDFNYPAYNCPCALIPGPSAPSFVGDNYYCESGDTGTYQSAPYYLNDALWDGTGCFSSNCCSRSSLQPWFHQSLNSVSSDDIEVRLCDVYAFSTAATLVDQLELYIQ